MSARKSFRPLAVMVVGAVLNVCASGLAHPQQKIKSAQHPRAIALIHALVIPSPASDAIADATIVIRDGKVVSIRQSGSIPPGSECIDCTGDTVLAGFWNSHVHFTEPIWQDAATAPAERVEAGLTKMFTRFGFTHVFDTGSDIKVSAALRKRVANGEVTGPEIRTAGAIIYPRNGAAKMLNASEHRDVAGAPLRTPTQPELDLSLYEAETPEQAKRLVANRLNSGSDAIKLYLQAWWDPAIQLPAPVIAAAIAAAHKEHKLVLAHPSNSYGLQSAAALGVDVLLHTTPQTEPWSTTLIEQLKHNGTSITPTLKLWRFELTRAGAPAEVVDAFQEAGVQQLRAWHRAGGSILFGTDVGYMPEADPAEEYRLMQKAGMGFRDILRSLTTEPARKYTGNAANGAIQTGKKADITVIQGNPDKDGADLNRVSLVIAGGNVVYRSARK